MHPDPSTSCGPYNPIDIHEEDETWRNRIDRFDSDLMINELKILIDSITIQ